MLSDWAPSPLERRLYLPFPARPGLPGAGKDLCLIKLYHTLDLVVCEMLFRDALHIHLCSHVGSDGSAKRNGCIPLGALRVKEQQCVLKAV